MKRMLAGVAAAALCLASLAHAGQYNNPDGSVSNGVVLESGAKPVGVGNGLVMNSMPEAALRKGRAYTAFTGSQVVTAGQYMSLLFSNPAGSGVRVFVTYRALQCDNPSSVLASKWWGLGNATANLPTTPATIAKLNASGQTPTAVTTFTASAATYPDTATATPLTSRPGGMVPTGGLVGGPLNRLRTVEPGQSISLTLLAIAEPAGLGTTNPTCAIDMDWYEEPAS